MIFHFVMYNKSEPNSPVLSSPGRNAEAMTSPAPDIGDEPFEDESDLLENEEINNEEEEEGEELFGDNMEA